MAKTTDPSVIANNRRKVEKDKRRKAYHDSQVQGTNDSSIVSKRSVEKIYNPVLSPDATSWFECFVPKAKRRSPAVNRIFWIRMECIKQAVDRISQQYSSQKVRVVNLGCGFDPLAFELLAQGKDFEFFDFDYPDVVSRKAGMIRSASQILDVVGPETPVEDLHRSLGVEFASPAYKLVGCDLNNALLYEDQLEKLIRGEGATIFIAEVSLAYMTPEAANKVIHISETIKDCHFISLEQILPSGRDYFFAEKMLYHFSHLNSPLQCVEKYPTKQLQRQRFEQIFANANVIDLLEGWNQLVSTKRKAAVALIEEFDEWEELILYCQHYVIIHATNSNCIFSTAATPESLPLAERIELHPISTPLEINIDSRFLAACATSSGVYTHGGMGQTRQDLLRVIKKDQISVIEGNFKPPSRMAHCMVDLKNGNILLLGGRTRPGHNYSDVWLFNETTHEWILLGDMPEGISRHSAVCSAPGVALVFANGKFYRVSTDEFDVTEAEANGIPKLKSCGMEYDLASNTGYVVGGMKDDLEPAFEESLFKFVYNPESNRLVFDVFLQSPEFGKVGCLTKMRGPELFIFGGVGYTPTTQNNTVIKVCLLTKQIFAVPIDDEGWKSLPVLIGAQTAGALVVGGGAVCYTFGDSYSKVYRIVF